jgi:hypothetical protein
MTPISGHVIPSEGPRARSIVGFGPGPAALVVASLAGSFYTAAFDPERGGACEQRSYCKFVELEGDAAA